jgi:hypothetical protein
MKPVIAESTLEGATVSDRTRRSWSPSIVLAGVVCVLMLYAYPYLVAYARLGAGPVPPIFAPDLYFYIGVSHIAAPVAGFMRNAWYGVEVPTAGFAYGRFHLAFSAYALLRSIAGGETAAFLIWTLGWTALICAAALWLVRKAVADGTTVLLLFALALLMLFDFDFAQVILLKWLRLRPWSAMSAGLVPFIRAFFPQVSIPLVLGYLGMQITALREGRKNKGWIAWFVMALLQFLVFCAFPYATAVLAATTAVLLLLLLAGRIPGSFLQFAAFGAVCAAADLGWLLFSGGRLPVANQGSSLIALDPQLLKRMLFSKTVLMLLFATVAAGVVCRRGVPKESRWTVVAFGTAVTLLSLADAVISPVVQASHHFLYLSHTAMALLTIMMVAAMLHTFAAHRSVRLAVWGMTAALFVNAAISIPVLARTFLELNRETYSAVRAMSPADLGAGDLVIANAEQVDSPAALVPTLSGASVLYYKNAELMVRSEYEKQSRLRQAIYLYATGMDDVSLGKILSPGGAAKQQLRIVPVQERMEAFGPHPEAALASLRSRLLPAMMEVEQGGAGPQAFFGQFKRLILVDSVAQPIFRPERLSGYLQERQAVTDGAYKRLVYVPQNGASTHGAPLVLEQPTSVATP